MSSLQGVPTLEVVQTALVASGLFLSLLVWEAVLQKRQRQGVPGRRRNRR